jgi:hypothetical protein
VEPIKDEIPCSKVIIGGLDGWESEAVNGKGDRARLRRNRERRGGNGSRFSRRGSGKWRRVP